MFDISSCQHQAATSPARIAVLHQLLEVGVRDQLAPEEGGRVVINLLRVN